MHELPCAVHRVHDPDQVLAANRLVHGGVGVHRFLADHEGAGQQGGEGVGEVPLGQAVGVRHEVVRAGLLVDLVLREPAEARHDLGRGRLADRILHVGRVTREKPFDGLRLFDHAPNETTRR